MRNAATYLHEVKTNRAMVGVALGLAHVSVAVRIFEAIHRSLRGRAAVEEESEDIGILMVGDDEAGVKQLCNTARQCMPSRQERDAGAGHDTGKTSNTSRQS